MADTRLCSIPGCGNRHVARGWCKMHYQRWRSNGDPLISQHEVPDTCTVDGCDRPYFGRGYCNAHYKRWRRHGSPTEGYVPRDEGRKWLDAHKDHQDNGCLTFPYSLNAKGYGQIGVDYKRLEAHRYMCRLAHGEPPSPEHEVAHSCGKGHEGCVNPQHLRWDTRRGNHADRIEHGTSNRGETHGNSKLTEAAVLHIRSASDIQAVASRYGITLGHAHSVRSRRSWGWLP